MLDAQYANLKVWVDGNQNGYSESTELHSLSELGITSITTTYTNTAIANNGKMMKPYLVNRIEDNGRVVKNFEPEVAEEKIAEESVIKAAQQCMLAVTLEGTGKGVFKNAVYSSGGKTGTAHVAGKGVRYDDGVYQASYVGYFPFEKPQYSCIVVIRTKPHPKVHMGGQVSAPVFKEIADKLLWSHFGLLSD